MQVKHTLDPVYFKDSKVLILGSIPSVKSREVGFYYAHPRNRFWHILEKVYQERIGDSKEEKIKFLKLHHIALFDVLSSCEINSSSDNSIKNPKVNDLKSIISNSNINVIFTTGKKAYELYNKYLFKDTLIKAIYLPSTSPANCPKGIEEKLLNSYKQIKVITDN